MAHSVTFKNIHPTETLTINVAVGNPGAPSVDIAPDATQAFDLDLDDADTQESLRHYLHAGALVVYTTP
jgi:hypothetical protein